MHGTGLEGWFYEGERPDRPADLGYVTGFLLCEAYYPTHGADASIPGILSVLSVRRWSRKAGVVDHVVPRTTGGGRPV